MAQVKTLVKDGDILLLAAEGLPVSVKDPADEDTIAQAFKVIADKATTTLALVPLGPTKQVPKARIQALFSGK